MKYDILITGVGGQGQVLASRLIGAAAIEAGCPARTGETIGMAQRGGSVVSNVRLGDELYGPTVPTAQADLIIGFELCETARVLPRLKAGGTVILNDLIIKPITVSLGMQGYDAQAMLAAIREKAGKLLVVDASTLTTQAGLERASNVVMLGAAVGYGAIPVSKETFVSALRKNLPPKYIDLNLSAFDRGYDFAREGI